MRILHVNIGYPPFVGGAQVFLRQIALRSSRQGHQVTAFVSNAREVESLWSPSGACLPVGREVDEGVTVQRFAIRYLPLCPHSYHALRRLTVELSRCSWIGQGILWWLARFTPWMPDLERMFHKAGDLCDLIHAWNIPFESLLGPAWRYARRWDIPFIITPLLHLGEATSDHVRRFYTMRHQIALLRGSDAVIALTPIEADYLVKCGVAPERVHVISGGVDEASLRRGDAHRFRARHCMSTPFVLYLGALNYEKGATYLVQAMAQLWEQGYPLDLVMAGQPMRHFLTFYSRLPAEQKARCHLMGLLSEEDKADALAACEMLALPSRTESFGLVYLEAWALGKPVIGARAGAVPAVIEDNVDGLLVPFGDVAALASSIAMLWDDRERAKALGEAGRRKVQERFGWDLIATQIEGIYQQVYRGKHDAR